MNRMLNKLKLMSQQMEPSGQLERNSSEAIPYHQSSNTSTIWVLSQKAMVNHRTNPF
jgi:hypothetical protein